MSKRKAELVGQSDCKRPKESEHHRQQRLADRRDRAAVKRRDESVEDREKRLSVRREQAARRRAIEKEKKQQCAEMLEKGKERQAAEANQERQISLEVNRRHAANNRAAECEEERQKRLEGKKQHEAKKHAVECEEERQKRLEEKKQHRAKKRAAECEEERQIRQAARRARTPKKFSWIGSAFTYNPHHLYSSNKHVVIGRMDKICSHCNAKKWPGEAPGMCCSVGKVKLDKLPDPPPFLKSLLCDHTNDSLHFQKNVWKYNNAFMMTSFGATANLTDMGFFTTFKVQGQVYHRIGSLMPASGEPVYSQVYFMNNAEEQVQRRCQLNSGVQPAIIQKLQEVIHSVNPYVHSFKYALEHIDMPDHKVVISADRRPAGEHERRFNAPASCEVSIIMVGEEHGKRDIVIKRKDAGHMRITETHRSYDALQYPLMFPYGEDGYCINLPKVSPATGTPAKTGKVSCKDFYAYRIMVRSDECNQLLRFKQVTCQFLTDMFAKVESERLLWIRCNQKTLRAELYGNLRDAMLSDGNFENVGKKVVLPSSHTGSPRYMHQKTQDAMCYVRKYGRPDLFLTFTCNPNWPEIQEELFEGQSATERPDVVARVFHEKHKKLLWLLKDGEIFGKVRCWMSTTEWQKRGLPHTHTLVWCKDRIRPDQVDAIICAEIPDKERDPELFDVISTHMIHGPCGKLNPKSPCMKENQCTKKFPREFASETFIGNDGYPKYRRRKPDDGGYTFQLKVRGQEVTVDNRWVVPFNPLLSKVFHTHFNVESCMSIKSIKYVCKYVNKGSDMAVFGVKQDGTMVDEVTNYQLGRYTSSNEAAWRIFGFDIHQRHPTVVHLNVHTENEQQVYFTQENVLEQALSPADTNLTGFFKLCQQDEFSRTLLFVDVPTFFIWETKNGAKQWSKRKAGKPVENWPEYRASDAIGRVYTVHPNQQECYYLRLLLHTVRGPTSFINLRTYEGEECSTYREACRRRGLLQDDSHWDATMQEAAVVQAPRQLRLLFAVLLKVCGSEIACPLSLWQKHRESMAEDFHFQCKKNIQDSILVPYTDAMFNQALILIEDKLLSLGGDPLHKYHLPEPQRQQSFCAAAEYQHEISYNVDQLAAFVDDNLPRMVGDQRAAYHTITDSIDSGVGGIFFLDAPGGTGKTFVSNLLLANQRRQRKVALAVASSGIAATLLDGGRTAHSAFKIPIDISKRDIPICNVSKGTAKAKILQECNLIIWDEATMSHKKAFEALDLTLKDLRKNNRLMGGVTVVLSGDFRQTLPIVPRGTRANEVHACIKSSHLWPSIKQLSLSTNMRVHLHGDDAAGLFASQLLQLGNGNLPAEQNKVTIPFGQFVASEDQLIRNIFPNFATNFQNSTWLSERVILAPKNDQVNEINFKLLQMQPGEAKRYQSIDTMVEVDEATNYPIEFLNSLRPPGTPPHLLFLKEKAPIMLLRNLEPPRLCNGTRLTIKKLNENVLEATIMTGQWKGEDVFIPKIPIIPTDVPFSFKRLQFPVQLSYAMSINKSQGQSLKVVGLELTQPVFSHGQLYVGCSRVGNPQHLYLLAETKGKTTNIVYHEVLGK